jgi:TRAP-type C4-dicarboxylate transport system permease large subunit
MEEVGPGVLEILLNGLSPSQFFAFYIAGLVGVVISFGIHVGQAVKKDPKTAPKFQLRELKFKAIRWVTSLLLLAVGIVFNKEILSAGLESTATIELTLWASLLVGMGTDRLGNKLAGFKK